MLVANSITDDAQKGLGWFDSHGKFNTRNLSINDWTKKSCEQCRARAQVKRVVKSKFSEDLQSEGKAKKSWQVLD